MRDEYFASGRYGRLRMGMGLRGPAFTSAERNVEDYAFARDLGLPISIHVGMAGTGHAVADLERDGLLGADVNYVHGNFLTDAEWDLLAASGGTVHDHAVDRHADAVRHLPRRPGPPSAAASSPASASTPSAARARTCSPRCGWPWRPNGPGPTPPRSRRDKMAPTVDLHQRDMLRLATIDGARVWHLEDEIGTLTPGKQADIAVIDLRSPHLDGFGDPVAVMVLGAGTGRRGDGHRRRRRRQARRPPGRRPGRARPRADARHPPAPGACAWPGYSSPDRPTASGSWPRTSWSARDTP